MSATTFGPTLSGELTIARDGATWRATIAGSEAWSQLSGDSLRFAFPDRLGGYRASLTDDGGTIRGFWLQPSAEIVDRATAQPFASPLVLRRVESNVWRGAVRPLEDRYTLYLRIFRYSDGTLIAGFRNPDMNARGGASQFRVSLDGDTVRFSARPDTTRPEIVHNAMLVRSPDRLRIFWSDLGHDLELTRRPQGQTPDFFPRPPGAPPYAYRRPPETGDGWLTAHARDVGMDEAALTRLVQRLIDADPAARRPALIHSMLVTRRGKRSVRPTWAEAYGRGDASSIDLGDPIDSGTGEDLAGQDGPRFAHLSRVLQRRRGRLRLAPVRCAFRGARPS
ncbi:MAG: hypothetical protein ABR527_06565 [Gemmatimonadota bacterium]